MSVAENLAKVRDRVRAACQASGRNADEVTLIAVSKTRSIEEIRKAYDLGQRHFGESRLQDALPKIESLPNDIVWHFIGPLQSNKAKKIAGVFDVVHAFCNEGQLKEANKSARPITGFIEVNIANEPQKSGLAINQLDEFYSEAIQYEYVRFRGLMTIGPVVSNAEEMRPYFRELGSQAKRLGLEWLSMGMSEDFEVAVQEGASHIRVGTAIFGSRQ